MATKNSTDNSTEPDLHGGRLRVPRTRGAFSGALLVILGAWGLLIPLVGPYVDFGYTPDKSFDISKARFWLEVLPGAVTIAGGLLLLVAANRLVTSFGAWLAVAGGAWFVVGPTLARLLHLGSIGVPIHTSKLGSTLETLLLFTGIGALILFLGALAVGRLGVVSVRDVKAAQRREQEKDRQDHLERERESQRYREEHEDRNAAPARDPQPRPNSQAVPTGTQPVPNGTMPVANGTAAGANDVDGGSHALKSDGKRDKGTGVR